MDERQPARKRRSIASFFATENASPQTSHAPTAKSTKRPLGLAVASSAGGSKGSPIDLDEDEEARTRTPRTTHVHAPRAMRTHVRARAVPMTTHSESRRHPELPPPWPQLTHQFP